MTVQHKSKPKTVASKKGISTGKKSGKTQETKTGKIKESFLDDVQKNIGRGAKIVTAFVSEVADDMSGKTTKISKDIFTKLKSGMQNTYESSTQIIEQLNENTNRYIDKYTHIAEVKKLNKLLDKTSMALGKSVLKNMKKPGLKEALEKNEEIINLLEECLQLNKQIVAEGKKLDKLSK